MTLHEVHIEGCLGKDEWVGERVGFVLFESVSLGVDVLMLAVADLSVGGDPLTDFERDGDALGQ